MIAAMVHFRGIFACIIKDVTELEQMKVIESGITLVFFPREECWVES